MQLSLGLGGSSPLAAIYARLKPGFCDESDGPRMEPVDQLVKSIISSRTYDEISWDAYLRLQSRFKPWERLIRASPEVIQANIHDVTFPEEKSLWVKGAMARIMAQRQELSLDFLAEGSVEEATTWLRRLPGVGGKVAAAVLNFSSLRLPAMVVDTHVWRVARRIGLAPPTVDPDAVQRAIMDAAPVDWGAGAFYDLHWGLKRLGQSLCTHDRTECKVCPIADLCATGRNTPPAEERGNVLALPPKPGSIPRSDVRRPASASLSLGCNFVDAAFRDGGLEAGAHEIAPAKPQDAGAPLAFGALLLVRRMKSKGQARALLVQASGPVRETGEAYAAGLHALGMDIDRLGVVTVRSAVEALRVVDEALRSGAVTAVLADLGREPKLDLSVTRRFNLSARRTQALAFLVTADLEGTSAALSRWRVAAAPSREHRRRGGRPRLGAPAFHLELARNRFGPTGAWTLAWNSHDQLFRPAPTLPLPVARPSADRSGASPAERLQDERSQRAADTSSRPSFGAHRQTG